MTVLAMAWDRECVTPVGYWPQNQHTTSASHFNTTYADAAFGTTSGSTSTSFIPNAGEQRLDFASSSGDFWFHGVFYIVNFGTATGEVLRFSSATGAEFRIRGVGSGNLSNDVNLRMERTTDGTTWTQVGSDFLVRFAVLHTMDLYLKPHATTGDIRLYLNNVLVSSATGTLPTQTNAMDRVLFGNVTTNTAGHQFYWSEIVAATEATFDWHVHTLPVTGAGNYSAWTGLFSDVDEALLDPVDINTTNTINNIQSYAVTNTNSTLVSNNAIKAVGIASATAISTDSTPTDVQHLVRVSSTDYFSADLGRSPDASTYHGVTIHNTNPNTAAAWVAAGVDGMEVGIRAVA